MTSKESWKIRYAEMHEENFKRNHPVAYADGYYVKCTIPDVRKANGLTNFVENFINWSGGRATRINNIARLPDKTVKSNGFTFTEKRFSRATRKGQADVSSTIKGKSIMWEIKVGSDRPSEHQLKEQAKERRAGGEYFFVHNPVEFFEYYDRIVSPELFI